MKDFKHNIMGARTCVYCVHDACNMYVCACDVHSVCFLHNEYFFYTYKLHIFKLQTLTLNDLFIFSYLF